LDAAFYLGDPRGPWSAVWRRFFTDFERNKSNKTTCKAESESLGFIGLSHHELFFFWIFLVYLLYV
jgi:hypothetical protein